MSVVTGIAGKVKAMKRRTDLFPMTRRRRPSRVPVMASDTKLRPRRYAPFGVSMEAGKVPPGLYLVATPIGNLGDVTLRALVTLAGADVIACEDTRVTRKLTERYGITTPLTAYHEHNAAEARPKLLSRLACRHAADLRSRLQAGARRPRGRLSGYGLARRVGRAHRINGFRTADGPLFLRRIPAAKASRTAKANSRPRQYSGNAGAVRRRITPGFDIGRPCGNIRTTRRSNLPRADQIARRSEIRES